MRRDDPNADKNKEMVDKILEWRGDMFSSVLLLTSLPCARTRYEGEDLTPRLVQWYWQVHAPSSTEGGKQCEELNTILAQILCHR